MIKQRETPTKFVQIPKTHIFAVKRTLYTRTDGEEREEIHFLQKLSSDKAMTLDKSTTVHMAPSDVVYACNIIRNNVDIKQAS